MFRVFRGDCRLRDACSGAAPRRRVKGRVVTERGEPIANADVRLGAFSARSRTHDKDEQKFLSAAIGDLATIRVR
jgi:hypothetical protein